MAWNRLGSLFALHSASYQGAFDESAFSCSYFGLEQLVTLSGSLPGSVPAVAVRPTSSSMCLLASSIAAGCTFCSQRRFKVIAAVKVPIASREKLLAGKQEVAEVAEVAGDAERVLNATTHRTGGGALVLNSEMARAFVLSVRSSGRAAPPSGRGFALKCTGPTGKWPSVRPLLLRSRSLFAAYMPCLLA